MGRSPHKCSQKMNMNRVVPNAIYVFVFIFGQSQTHTPTDAHTQPHTHTHTHDGTEKTKVKKVMHFPNSTKVTFQKRLRQPSVGLSWWFCVVDGGEEGGAGGGEWGVEQTFLHKVAVAGKFCSPAHNLQTVLDVRNPTPMYSVYIRIYIYTWAYWYSLQSARQMTFWTTCVWKKKSLPDMDKWQEIDSMPQGTREDTAHFHAGTGSQFLRHFRSHLTRSLR